MVTVGSHNYLLADETSDIDKKLFVLPEFDDLYNMELFSVPDVITQTVDYAVHDIRKLPKLLWGANIAYIEVLFSNYICSPYYDVMPDEINQLYGAKNRIARMNLFKMFESCMGGQYQRMCNLKKGTGNTQHLIEKFGYCTKQACHAYRNIDVLIRYADTDFTDFGKAIRYDVPGEAKTIMDIKQGRVTEKDFRDLMDDMRIKAMKLRDKYKSIPPNEECLAKINSLVRALVKGNVVVGEYRCLN
jgi:predicted nucleotidyltransferase